MDTTFLRPYGRKLWVPGQIKPTGLPKIDWSHPLASKLICFWFPFGDSGYIDLVTGDVTKKGTGTRNVLPVLNGSSFGPGPGFTATSHHCEATNFSTVQSFAAPYSIACGFYQLGAAIGTSFPAYFGLFDTSGTNSPTVFLGGSNTAFSIAWANGVNQFSFTFASNTFYVVVGAATGASASSAWVNGLTQTAGTATTTFSGTNLGAIFGGNAYNSSDGTDNINAVVYFGAIWNGRALSAADASLLYSDPYCFLVPAEPEMMIIQAAAVADVLGAQIWL